MRIDRRKHQVSQHAPLSIDFQEFVAQQVHLLNRLSEIDIRNHECNFVCLFKYGSFIDKYLSK